MASKPAQSSDVGAYGTHSSTGIAGWLRALATRIGRPLVYSSVYLAVVAGVEVLIVVHLLSLPPSPAALVVALVTFSIYANDRLVDMDSDAASNPRRTAWVRRHRRPLYVLGALAYGLAVGLSALGGPLAFGLALLPGLVWILYAVEWVPTPTLPFGRLKEIFLVNSALVAVVWALTVVLVPIAFAADGLTPKAAVALGYFALAAFVSVEISNVTDIETDRLAGVDTLATVLGVARTRWVLYGLSVAGVALLGATVFAGVLTPGRAAILSVGYLGLTAVVAGLGRVDEETLLTIGAECTRLPVFVLLALPMVG